MFVDVVYRNRRNFLKHKVESGLIWIQGNELIGMNYKANAFPFVQDSSFLYYTGIDRPGLHFVYDIDEDKSYLYGDEYSLDELIWIGPQSTLEELKTLSGIDQLRSKEHLFETLEKAKSNGRIIHTLPSYQANHSQVLTQALGNDSKVSMQLIHAIIEQRSIKEDREIIEMEEAVNITAELHIAAMKMANEGVTEADIHGKIMDITLARGCRLGYPAIITTQGDVLHMTTWDNILAKDQLLLCDMGVTNSMGYTADITRTTPVNRRFNQQQKATYNICLNALETATASCSAGVQYKDVHLSTCRLISQGLKELGLMKGNIDEAVNQGAHALFMPHGLGHMIGHDVHDMENLGENHVGYDQSTSRSEQFGLAYLRLGKTLRAGNVITVEPGLYFIKPLFDKWRAEKKFESFLNYDEIEKYMGLGGIRIEDNVLINRNGHRVLGARIPKTVEEIENLA